MLPGFLKLLEPVIPLFFTLKTVPTVPILPTWHNQVVPKCAVLMRYYHTKFSTSILKPFTTILPDGHVKINTYNRTYFT